MTSHSSVFEKDVLLDIAVNIIPLVIMLAFAVLFWVVDPWTSSDLLSRVLQYALIVLPFVGLAILTYVAANRIEVAEDVEVGP
ncbi:DUF6684 family protein [Halarchaeum sp. P4]|uniref:DUF6684 family protein n=1 Tax=Halarchaeum sp. P4 TaxID=3421639 RepID=UPI003EBEDC26